MKRLLTLLIIFSSAVVVSNAQTFEQTDRGSHLAGGTISFNNSFSSSSQPNNQFTLNINPNYGYFFANNFAVGGELNITYSTSQASDLKKGLISPFVRYYIGPPKAWMLFAYTSLGIGVQKYSSDISTNKSYGLWAVQAGPGLDYFVNNHVAFEGLLTYSGSQVNASNVSFNNNLNLRIGLQVYF